MTDTMHQPTADLLYGCEAIAEFLGIKKRAAQHLVETNRLPHFKVGRTICARKSAIAAKLAELEAEASAE